MARRAAFGGLTVKLPARNAPIYGSRVEQVDPLRVNDDPVWYVMRPEDRSGALRFAELRLLVDQQRLRIDDLVWRPGWDRWYAAWAVPGLFPVANGNPLPGFAAVKQPLKPSAKERVKHELRSYFAITIYIWAVLGLLRLHESIIADSYNLDLKTHGWLIITALVLGKVVLISEALHLGKRISKAVPAIVILIKSLLFALAILLFHVLEHVIVAYLNGEKISQHLPPLTDANIKRSLATTGLATLALMPYFLVKEIERATGMRDLLLLAIGLKSGSRQDQ